MKKWGNPGVPTESPVTYDGQKSKSTVSNLINWTIENEWSGIDFDDELTHKAGATGFNYKNVAEVVKAINSNNKESSYTALAGYNFANKIDEYNDFLEAWNDADGNFDRLNLMTYAGYMWDRSPGIWWEARLWLQLMLVFHSKDQYWRDKWQEKWQGIFE